jgi:hypothetical protein
MRKGKECRATFLLNLALGEAISFSKTEIGSNATAGRVNSTHSVLVEGSSTVSTFQADEVTVKLPCSITTFMTSEWMPLRQGPLS